MFEAAEQHKKGLYTAIITWWYLPIFKCECRLIRPSVGTSWRGKNKSCFSWQRTLHHVSIVYINQQINSSYLLLKCINWFKRISVIRDKITLDKYQLCIKIYSPLPVFSPSRFNSFPNKWDQVYKTYISNNQLKKCRLSCSIWTYKSYPCIQIYTKI